MNTQRFYLSGVVSLIVLQSALGQQLLDRWTFQGVLTMGLPDSPYRAGLPYTVNFYVDKTLISPNDTGLYFPTVTVDFIAGCCGFGNTSLGLGVLIANDRPTGGAGSFDGIVFSVTGERSRFPTGILFDGSAHGITLVSSSTGLAASPFTDTSFPSALDLNQFSQRYLTVGFESPSGPGTVRGTVDSLFINGVLISQVPEPSCSILVSLGISTLLGYRFWPRVQRVKTRRPGAYL
jgi:hypothetical protein